MRIIAGRWRGRPLTAPSGAATRPTADRTREALFSMLASRVGSFEGLAAADLFAGSGALGLEALSRGAASVTLMEIDRAALAVCRANARKLGGDAAVLQADCLKPPKAKAPCGLVFLDPPYREDVGGLALLALRKAGWIAPAALAVVEIAAKQDLATPEGFELLDERRYGAAKLLFFRAP